ncbi:hypothetical protein CFK37_08450 [Virgibacillus phasianinus]|uniref:Uncharacterized protein n=1 Tax=Virgibacillus phasianinus TaxID=2017483 RepID=A0A220U274_9BACI|nr:hypothetical protein [Virgibacillus phasianinus]ASK62190.1 hypothetical protein CFK37_08450 [Virgibacillus phasianinus]
MKADNRQTLAEVFAELREEGYKEGYEIGYKKEMEKLAEGLIKENTSNEQIAEITELGLDEVARLRKPLNM